MNSIKKISTFVAGAMVALLLAVGAGSAFADTPVVDTIWQVAQTDGEDAGIPDAAPPENGRGGVCANDLIADYLSEDDVNAAVAGALGISVEELTAAKEDGTRLSELAEELDVDMADVQAAKLGVVEGAVADALADGAITQEQADQILERAANPGRRGGGKHGGRGGNGAPPVEDTNGA